MAGKPTIAWTYTDEAPMLATFSLLPIVQAYTKSSGIEVKMEDISVAGRVLGVMSDHLKPEQKVEDVLTRLGKDAESGSANIIKLPNVSASVPQLNDAIAELQAHGYAVPNYPQNPTTPEEEAIKAKYGKVVGSAVNPVLREGNSDRRAATSVKNYAKKFPHKMGEWKSDSKSHVSHMTEGDFYGSEQSTTCEEACSIRIEFVSADGDITVKKEKLALEKGEIIDSSCMSAKKLREFYEKEMVDAKAKGVLCSLHLKATMMKVSDPILFGHAVSVYFKSVFDKHADTFKELGINPNNGFADVTSKIKNLDEAKRKEIEADIDACYAARPDLAMVDSSKGITNLHVPSDVIIDASMPAAIRGMDGLGGGMWCPDSKPGANDSHLKDAKYMIPDRCYAGVFAETVEFCKKNGKFDVTTMGSVPNVGLMAKKAEEYGSHDKTFQATGPGKMRVVNNGDGNVIMEHDVDEGDVWRMCQTKDKPIQNWVKLAVERTKLTNWATIFWLDVNRAHDRQILKKVKVYLEEHDTNTLDITILAPREACAMSLQRAKDGLNTISVTGNVLRDYNTDLFPIIELGTSAKMLSIVPMLNGGNMFETGAGGSAPKHVEQFVKENHLRWDSLGEFLALGCSLEDIGKNGNAKIQALAASLDAAVGRFLAENKNPGRKVKQIDNRGSHFYLAYYWAEECAKSSNGELKAEFGPIAAALKEKEAEITQQMIDCQGDKTDIGGYYHPDHAKLNALMRPSATFNEILARL